MNGFLLLIPLILIRFGLLNKEGLKRAAFFVPLIRREKTAYWFYQISNILIFVYLFFLKITTDSYWFYVGLATYGLGVLMCLASVSSFAKPAKNGINLKGLYRISRNPMYVSYFIYFLGCVLLTQSLLLLAILVAFQISTHWIILSEERWCIKKFGEKGELDHYIGVATSSNETLDFDVLSIEPGTWAVFESIGPFPETLQNVWVDEGNSKVGPRNSPKFRP
jgi:protein-S-isoprenylcysteine O-methyltransferase Ste14